MDISFLDQVGVAGSPLPKLPKQERNRLRRVIMEGQIHAVCADPSIRVRAHVLAGIRPIPELISTETLKTALNSSDIPLCYNWFGFIHKTYDLSVLLQALLERISLDKASGKQVISATTRIFQTTRRLLKKQPRKVGVKRSNTRGTHPSELTRESVERLCELLVRSATAASASRKRPAVERCARYLANHAVLLCSIVSEMEDLQSKLTVLETIEAVRREAGISIGSKLGDRTDLSRAVAAIVKSLSGSFLTVLEGNQLDSASRLFRWVEKTPMHAAEIRTQLEELLRNPRTSALPETLAWAERVLQLPKETSILENLHNESHSARLEYVASVLLDAGRLDPQDEKVRTFVERLKRLVRDLFGLTIVGQEGEIESYDPRRHELGANVSIPEPSRVRIIRPAVFWTDGTRQKCVLRAAVEIN